MKNGSMLNFFGTPNKDKKKPESVLKTKEFSNSTSHKEEVEGSQDEKNALKSQLKEPKQAQDVDMKDESKGKPSLPNPSRT